MAVSTAFRRSRSRIAALFEHKEIAMSDDPREEHVPLNDPKAKQRGEETRKAMDEVPEHGTDPLHEGP
jgi:hypothetical protein